MGAVISVPQGDAAYRRLLSLIRSGGGSFSKDIVRLKIVDSAGQTTLVDKNGAVWTSLGEEVAESRLREIKRLADELYSRFPQAPPYSMVTRSRRDDLVNQSKVWPPSMPPFVSASSLRTDGRQVDADCRERAVQTAAQYVREHYSDFVDAESSRSVRDGGDRWIVEYQLPEDGIGGAPVVFVRKADGSVVNAYMTQ